MTFIRTSLILCLIIVLILPNNAKSKIYTDDKGKLALSVPEYSGFKTHTNYMSQNSYNYVYIEDEMAARRGKFYQRFELRDGDCFGDDTWNDCEKDRERVEFSSRPRQDPSGNQCFAYSIKLDKDFIDVHPTNTDLGQIHQKGGPSGKAGGYVSLPPLIQMSAKRGKFYFKWHSLTGSPTNVIDEGINYYLLDINDMVEKWNDISFCLNYEDELMQVWVNGNKKHEIANSPINFIPDSTYFKYGIYRSFVSRYKNRKERIGQEAKLPTQIVYYDEIRRGNSITEVDFNINPDLIPID